MELVIDCVCILLIPMYTSIELQFFILVVLMTCNLSLIYNLMLRMEN